MSTSLPETIDILHVDDEPEVADLAATYLEREDDRNTVRTATSADEGMEVLMEHDVDCIVSDYDMPRTNGIEFLETVREEYPELPFILYTGKGSEEVASDAISAGVTDYLQKETGPDQYTVLANRIRNAVSGHEAEMLVNRSFRAMEQSREGIALLDEDGEFLFVNDAYTEIVGYDETELVGEFWERVYPDDQVDRVYNEILPTVPEEGHWTGQTVYQHKDGSRIRVDHAIVYSEEGTMICLLRAITDTDAYERELHRERQRFDLLIDAVDDYAICTLDSDGYITTWNTGAERNFAYTEDEILGAHFSTLYTEEQHPEELLELALEEGSVEQRSLLVRKDGSTYQAKGVITALFDEDGEHRGYGQVTEDITEREAREQELERYETIVETAGDPVYTLDSEGHFTAVNEALVEISGYDEEEFLGEHASKVMSDEHVERGAELIRELLSSHRNRGTFEMDLINASGQHIPCENHIGLLPFDEEFQGTVGIVRDISDRKERERELEREHERFTALYENFPDPTITYEFVDNEPVIRAVNDAFFEVFGYDVEAAIESSIDDLLVPADELDEAQSLNERVRAGELVDEEMRRLTADGEGKFWFRNIPIPGSEGPDGFAVYIDITERQARTAKITGLHKVATELEASETQPAVYERLVEAAEDVLDYDLAIADAVQGDVMVPEAVSSDIASDEYFERTPISASDNLAARAFRTGESSVVDDLRTRGVTPAQSEYRAVLTVPIGDYGIFQAVSTEPGSFDDTDRELAELLCDHAREALANIEHHQELQRQNERLEEFAGVISHDLRNPLSVAQGRLNLASEDCDSDHLEHVARAHDRMETLIDDVLSLARAGTAVGETQPVELADLVESCWRNVETASARIINETDDAVRADRSRLQQLIENLLRNAVEHGGSEVAVTVGDLPDGFYVADDGPGIPEDERQKVLEPGYSSSEAGTGFGLSIVRDIAQAHGWELRIAGGEEGGARFEFTGVETV